MSEIFPNTSPQEAQSNNVGWIRDADNGWVQNHPAELVTSLDTDVGQVGEWVQTENGWVRETPSAETPGVNQEHVKTQLDTNRELLANAEGEFFY